MALHAEEQPYACTICHKTFKVKAYLKKHQQEFWYESPNKPINCQIWNKSVKYKSNFKRHLIRHAESDRTRLQRAIRPLR